MYHNYYMLSIIQFDSTANNPQTNINEVPVQSLSQIVKVSSKVAHLLQLAAKHNSLRENSSASMLDK